MLNVQRGNEDAIRNQIDSEAKKKVKASKFQTRHKLLYKSIEVSSENKGVKVSYALSKQQPRNALTFTITKTKLDEKKKSRGVVPRQEVLLKRDVCEIPKRKVQAQASKGVKFQRHECKVLK